MKRLVNHKINELNNRISILYDDPDESGASHIYNINVFTNNDEMLKYDIKFQKGPILENGYNGISNEVLLAIVENRLQGFQNGPFACKENNEALIKLQECMMWLERRTRDRINRGVEGTNQL